MATKRPAKIASQKKRGLEKRGCPACDSEMSMARVIQQEGPSGMFWLCDACSALVTTQGARVGTLPLK